MATYSTAGIVLKRTSYGEADRLITLLTEKHGRITAIARGVRKPLSKLRGFLELFTYGIFRLAEGKTFDTVVEVTPTDYFKQIREDPQRQQLAYGLVEMIIVTLQDKEPHRGMLEWVAGWLNTVNDEVRMSNAESMTKPEAQNNSSFGNSGLIGHSDFRIRHLFYTAMLIQYLSFIGHAPNLWECGVCRQPIQPEQLGWSHNTGGFVHYQCGQMLADIKKLDPSIGKLTRFLADNSPTAIRKLNVDQALIQKTANLVYDFFRYQVGRELRLRV